MGKKTGKECSAKKTASKTVAITYRVPTVNACTVCNFDIGTYLPTGTAGYIFFFKFIECPTFIFFAKMLILQYLPYQIGRNLPGKICRGENDAELAELGKADDACRRRHPSNVVTHALLTLGYGTVPVLMNTVGN